MPQAVVFPRRSDSSTAGETTQLAAFAKALAESFSYATGMKPYYALMPDTGSPQENTVALEELTAQVRVLSARVIAMSEGSRVRGERILAAQADALRVLELTHDDDPGTRRRLHELRARADYDEAFTVSDPLVSVVIPTWNRPETLIERAIPSALAQTHTNLEVIVVGDASPPEIGAAIDALDDGRVTFHNLTIRGPYDEEPFTAWHAYGTPGMNAGIRLSRGAWIAPLGDDDAFVPEHIARLLAAARDARLEFVYGLIHMILPDGSESLLGEFPPRMSQIGLQAALFHAGLRFIEFELGHALFHKPNDWGLVHRMMRTGVRMGMVKEVSVDYWPSQRDQVVQPEADPLPHPSELAGTLVALEDRVSGLEQRLSVEQQRSSSIDAHAAELARRLEEVRRSRSWRLTAPFRRMRQRS